MHQTQSAQLPLDQQVFKISISNVSLERLKTWSFSVFSIQFRSYIRSVILYRLKVFAVFYCIMSWYGKIMVSQLITLIWSTKEFSWVRRTSIILYSLYIDTAISCKRLLYKLDRFAFWRSSWYLSEFELNTDVNTFSWIRSNFLLSDVRKKCHTKWQYVRCSRSADLHSCNFAQVEINLRNCNSTGWRLLFDYPFYTR